MSGMAGVGASLYSVAEAARACGGTLPRGPGGRPITGVATDSRALHEGDLFVAIRGRLVDGHRFVGDAFAAGAAAALVSSPVSGTDDPLILVDDTVAALGRLARFHRDRFPRATVIGITGSVGKTTTKEMVASVLAVRFPVLKSPGNYNTEIGLPLTLLEMREEHRVVILEMAMRGPGQIRHLARLARPRVGVITYITETHTELLGSVENIALAKRELIEALPADGIAVLNADDPRQREMAGVTPARIVWYGLGADSQVTASSQVPRGSDGVTFLLEAPGLANETALVDLPLPGRHHVADALAAAAVGLSLGLTPAEVARGLAAFEPVEMRSRIVRFGSVTVIDDTYNASPASMRAALNVLEEVASGRRVAVLGDMLELGEGAADAHRAVGRDAAGLDQLVTVGSLARHFGEGAAAGGLDVDRIRHWEEAGRAAADLTEMLEPGDTVLVKGSRGMHMEVVVEGLRRWAGEAAPAGGGRGKS